MTLLFLLFLLFLLVLVFLLPCFLLLVLPPNASAADEPGGCGGAIDAVHCGGAVIEAVPCFLFLNTASLLIPCL